jgi:PPOX class probable F420-dependent enzyme
MANRALADEPYIDLESFKRDGSTAHTPVWCAPLDGRIVIFTAGDSFKVKRVRRDPRVRVRACNVRGDSRGPASTGRCAIVDDPDHEARAYQALTRKYGWQMRLLNLVSTLGGRIGGRVVLEITLDAPG